MSHDNKGFYEIKKDMENYDDDTKECIEDVIKLLSENNTYPKEPGMLLGKVQSGKTRTFIGIIALAFDRGYDIAIILTKSTKVLAKQTFDRLSKEFECFVEEDKMKIYDIMTDNTDGLSFYIRNQKLIFVIKKQTHNLDAIDNLFNIYEDFKNKKVLIIDDEADYASIGFKKDNGEIFISTIAEKVNMMRVKGIETSFLQVTATPYNLYLQITKIELGEKEYNWKPAFTKQVPVHGGYIGGEYYFEKRKNQNSPAAYLYVEVPEKELAVLSKNDQHHLGNILTTPNLKIFRSTIVNFLVGGVIRQLQENSKPQYKCSCIIHTTVSKKKHEWQYSLLASLITSLEELAKDDAIKFEKMVKDSYSQFELSFRNSKIPDFHDVLKSTISALLDGYIGVEIVNSDAKVSSLLDNKGQLRLDNPFNIFIGGQILDRGITIENLICFFYGRNPKTMQQDTVLQHSRMYGARSEKDMLVTRFYTSYRIYHAMKKMHSIDESLWNAFKQNPHTPSSNVIFIEKDSTGQTRICAPNKIVMSKIEILKPHKRILPIGMQTVSQTKMKSIEQKIETILSKYNSINQAPFIMAYEDAIEILSLINNSYEFSANFDNKIYKWDFNSWEDIIKQLCKGQSQENGKKLFCLIRRNREMSRYKDNKSFSDAPDDGRSDLPPAREVAQDMPALMLIQQKGLKDKGWRDAPFWWPVLICHKNIEDMIFSLEPAQD